MNVLVVGGGGREHALCWKLAQSEKINKLYCAPGNAGTAQISQRLDILPENHIAILEACKIHRIELVIVGPEGPLVEGLTDVLERSGIKTFGPKKQAAMIEGSKILMKELLRKYNIPTAPFQHFCEPREAIHFIKTQGVPIVVKADGLAGGKGVIVAKTEEEAIEAVEKIMTQLSFGNAGKKIIIEKFLNGQEVSFFALVDGANTVSMATAQDHKTALDGDKGQNTGGMGAYSPALLVDKAMDDRVMEEIINPVAKAMVAEKRPYRGVLFAGLMLDNEGPKVIEFNCRFGDPECQAIIPRLKSDLFEVICATVEGNLGEVSLEWDKRAALSVIMAARGYPGSYKKNTKINGVDIAEQADGVLVFHSGTEIDKFGELRAAGGRVLGVVGLGSTIKQAQKLAYEGVELIDWDDGFYRRDIGWRAI
ncbi:MAG: Phosphoribosylamine--glycine ligase [Alphaproteobacteria bacterium MarineAlpha3_Bin5]|nr:phosphoribosylamine--glycine ligase [Magnetovibrio sp.]PPR77128.1 MAG: Phosphoribosylamine--glycine ligase [Alphaproteobacteria bacterium MarineAlpha3_Bin5]